MLLFDVYLTWARIEKAAPSPDVPESSNFGRLAQQPIVYQYVFFCTCTLYSVRPGMLMNRSNPLCPLNPRLSHFYSLSHLLTSIPIAYLWSTTHLPTAKLRIYSTPCLLINNAVPDPDGHMGLRYSSRCEIAGLGGSCE